MEGPLYRLLISAQSVYNMAAIDNFCFWFVAPLKPLGQTNSNLEGNIYGRSPIEIVHLVSISKQTWLS